MEVEFHRKLLFLYYTNKIEEHLHFLSKIYNISFRPNRVKGEKISYYFNAYISTVSPLEEALLDIFNIKDKDVPEHLHVNKIPNYIFYKNTRNAILHNSTYMISMWIENRYYFSKLMSRLSRVKSKDLSSAQIREIRLDKPGLPVIYNCLIFSLNFIDALLQLFIHFKDKIPCITMRDLSDLLTYDKKDHPSARHLSDFFQETINEGFFGKMDLEYESQDAKILQTTIETLLKVKRNINDLLDSYFYIDLSISMVNCKHYSIKDNCLNNRSVYSLYWVDSR